MKNKHLVLLFFAVLIVGLVARFLPVRYQSLFQADLIQVDTAALSKIEILVPGQPILSLERADSGWAADQNGRIAAVSEQEITVLLGKLESFRNFRTIKTALADTLGFIPSKQLQIRLFEGARQVEYFEIGNETTEDWQPFTYLQLPRHKGIYLVNGHLRDVFSHTLDDFRSRKVLSITPESICRVGCKGPGSADTIFYVKNDSTRVWTGGSRVLPDDSVQTWLSLFNRLNDSPFADNFDESQENETRIATLIFERPGNSAFAIRFFYLKPPDIPEDLSNLRKFRATGLPAYVFHSSENPANYFAATDSNLVHVLCYTFWPKTDTTSFQAQH